MERLENRMVIDSVWGNLEKKKSYGPGYYNPRTGVFVPEEKALDYMIDILKGDPDRADDVMEHFYENWIKEG